MNFGAVIFLDKDVQKSSKLCNFGVELIDQMSQFREEFKIDMDDTKSPF